MPDGVIHPVIACALGWAEDLDFSDAAPVLRRYRLRHEALRRLFRRYVRLDDFHTVLAGAAAACGFARRPLGEVERPSFERARAWLSFLSGCADSREPFEALQRKPEAQRCAALTFIDGSVASTCVFLHFLNPDCAPMWPARAARRLNPAAGPQHSELDAAAIYCDYWRTLLDAAEAGAALPPRLRNVLNAPVDPQLDRDRRRISPVLGLETLLCLYASPVFVAAPSPLRQASSRV